MNLRVTGGGYRRNLDCKVFVLLCTILAGIVFFGLSGIALAESSSSNLTITLDPVISIRVMKNNTDISNLALDVSPTASGSFVKDDLYVLVSTSNETGYTLTMANNDTDTSLHHVDTTITTTIPSISTSTDESNFPVNSWAYSLGDITSSAQQFSPIPLPTSAATIKTTAIPSTEDTTNVTFATKIDTSVPAGTYQDTIVFTATTNYVPNNLERIGTMQAMTPEICASATIGDEAILTDTRDNKTYVVRKLKDGRCWMVQNLALGGASPITLTPADSNVSANFTLSASSNNFGTTDNATNTNINRMHDNGDNWVTAIIPGNNSTVQTSGTPPSQTQYQGNYYNWYTATAGSGTYSMNTSSQNATQSICPKGWRLPNGSAIGNGEFQKLHDAYGSYNDFISATSAILSGNWYNSFADSQGSYGRWWSRTAVSATDGYGLIFDASSISPQFSSSKRAGNSIRCIADNTITGISTMQQMTSDICAATPTPAASATTIPQTTLIDTRDGNTYIVRKLADGNCWMAQNLMLGGNQPIILTAQDSDISQNFTLSASSNSFGMDSSANGININRVYSSGDAQLDNGYIGNYYNWYTATAGSGTYSTSSGNIAPYSICPKGWKLPTTSLTSSDNGDFQNLYNAYGNYTSFFTATFSVRSGAYKGSAAIEHGLYGYWWSSVAYDAAVQATSLYVGGSTTPHVGTQYPSSKWIGYSVRCVAR